MAEPSPFSRSPTSQGVMRLRSADNPKDPEAEHKLHPRSLDVAITQIPLPSPAALAGTSSYCPQFGTATQVCARAELDTLQTA